MADYRKSSVHCHSTLCDGKNTLQEMAGAACAQGLTTLGFSGHSYTKPDREYCMTPGRTAQYRATIAKLKNEYRGKVDILCGIEWDLLSEGTPKGFDYWIGSAHHLYGKNTGKYYEIDFRPEDLRDCINNDFDGDPLAAVEAYFAEVEKIAAKKPDILGHIDLVKKLNADGSFFDEESPRYKAAALKALQAARENDCILEVNTGGVYRGYRKDFYPGAWLLGEWNKLGGRVIITADAHDTAALTFGFDEAAAAIKAAGFTALPVLTVKGFEQLYLKKCCCQTPRFFRNYTNKIFLNRLTAKEATAHKKCATASFLREERNPMTQTRPLKTNLFNRNADLLHGPIFKNLFLFMLPILVSNLFQQLYNTVDTMIVGNVLGDTALAAIGSCGSIYELLVGFGIGIGNGLSIVAARSYGAQDEDLLKRTVAGSLVIGLCASFVITTAGFFGLRPLLQLLDTPAEILEDAYRYIIVIDLGVLVMFFYNLCAGLLRAIGNSVMPLVFLLISSGLNVALDLWFIAGLGMGVQGAAVATVIAQGISVVLCILYVMRRVPLLLPARKHWAVGQHLYWELFSQSISMGLMSSIVSAGSVVLQYGINGLGTLTIAGHTAARKLFSFTSMPLISMANAGSTFVSQNRGAAQPERVRKGMRTMYLCSVVIMAAEVVLMQLFARQLVQLISGSTAPLVLENGARYLMWNAPFYAVLGVLLCTRYALQSLGQKVLPLFSSVIELVGKVIFVLVFIPRYAYNAVILCEPIIWCFMAAYLVAVYRRDAFVYPRKNQ